MLPTFAFREVWVVDFEFVALPGERPQPVCLVAHELTSNRKIRLWREDLLGLSSPPYSISDDALFVAYYASAELGCHLSLDWSLPAHVLDLYVEFRNATNGKPTFYGQGLLGALAWYGLDGIDAQEKEAMRELILSGGPWTASEQQAILAYCESDVTATAKLLRAMWPGLDLTRARLRGRYMPAAARMEHTGVPIDVRSLHTLREHWTAIKDRLIARINAPYGVYEGRTFKEQRWAAWLARNGIPWPRLVSGGLALDDNTFRDMARCYPQVMPMKELRATLGKMRLGDLAVGKDGRNRCVLSAFKSKTGRNQPSNSRFIFGPAVWLRGLIQPPDNYGLAYIDWSQQEFGIAAALSGDPLMQEAYLSGDPYLAFAKQAGAVPQEATKHSHGSIREQYKACALGVQYGMGADSLALRINQSQAHARELLNLHKQTYRKFWRWSDGVVDHAMLNNRIWTVYGWLLHVGSGANIRSIRNFPMQANGAEMLRLASCFATEKGVSVCAPVHDALLIEAPFSVLDAAVNETRDAMVKASAWVLNGFELRCDVKVVRCPDRFMDERGELMWATVWELVGS